MGADSITMAVVNAISSLDLDQIDRNELVNIVFEAVDNELQAEANAEQANRWRE